MTEGGKRGKDGKDEGRGEDEEEWTEAQGR